MNQVVSFILSFGLMCVIVYEIYQGKTIASDEASSIRRVKESKQFWLSILFQTFLALGFLAIGLINHG